MLIIWMSYKSKVICIVLHQTWEFQVVHENDGVVIQRRVWPRRRSKIRPHITNYKVTRTVKPRLVINEGDCETLVQCCQLVLAKFNRVGILINRHKWLLSNNQRSVYDASSEEAGLGACWSAAAGYVISTFANGCRLSSFGEGVSAPMGRFNSQVVERHFYEDRSECAELPRDGFWLLHGQITWDHL